MLKLAKSVVQRIGGESSNGVALNGKVAQEDAPSLSVPAFLVVTLQLGLVLFAMHLFQIETATGFNRLFPIIFGGFIVHAWLPKALRMPFFVALSGAGIVTIFGFSNTAWLVGIGLVLMAMCHLPIAKWMRVTLVTLAGAGLTALRAGYWETSWSVAILPVLGSMFMFRIALYLYDMDAEKKKATIWERLAYFFMLPNTVFPFFPIIDYIQFRRSYYDKDDITIYQKGVLWMLRGAIHLILYRVVYYYYTPAVEDVEGLAGVLLFIVSAYMLYLRVSGLFHLIIGLMCLFGFNLPETHKQYFLASSFNDYWRRINIYWKDFMMKLFFYPMYMKTRSWGPVNALVFSTVVVFFFTWLLHSYQWFWLQGDFPILVVDAVYWGVLGVLVAINSVWEIKRGKAKNLSTKKWEWSPVLKLTLKTVVTFVFLALMWSYWSSDSSSDWWRVMSQAGNGTASEWGLLLWGLVGLFVLLVLKEWLESKNIHVFFDERKMSFSAVASRTGVMAVGLVLIGMPEVNSKLGEGPSEYITSLQETRLNARDAAIEERGYYEGLMDGRSYTSQLSWSNDRKPPEHWRPIMESDLVEDGEGVVIYQLKSNLESSYKDAAFSTNSAGLRDKEYALEKDSTTLRVALLGASYEQGAGVANHQTFENVLEDSLNANSDYRPVEILNFAIGGYSPVQNVTVAEEKMVQFGPDVALYAMYSTEKRRMLMQMENIVQQNRQLPYPFISELIEKSGAKPEMSKEEIRALLDPYAEELLTWSFQQIAEISRSNGITPVALMMPTTRELKGIDEEWKEKLITMTNEAGFTLIDMEGAYGEVEELAIALAVYDQHPNVLGHRLLARRLLQEMEQRNELFELVSSQ